MSARPEEVIRETSKEDLYVAMDEEAARLAEIFADTDWSGNWFQSASHRSRAEIVFFEEKGRHWWSRTRSVEYAMMPFLEVWRNQPCRDRHCYDWHPTIWVQLDSYLRSDGTLYFKNGGLYQSPSLYFTDASREEVQRALSYIARCQEPRVTRIDI